MKIYQFYILGIFISLSLIGCYSFKGISISPNTNTFYVEDFYTKSLEAPGDIEQLFSESLRLKIRNESRLKYTETDPDIVFSGNISKYRITAVAARDDNSVELNQLTIDIAVSYINNRDDEDTWDKTFSFFQTFPSDSDVQSIQDQLIEDIFKQLTENIFNEAFTNW
jgi:hypothetical protein